MTRPLTRREFIRKARLVHGNLYKYHRVVYVRNKQNVIIICRIHGDFKQTPDNHLHRRTCKKCAKISPNI